MNRGKAPTNYSNRSLWTPTVIIPKPTILRSEIEDAMVKYNGSIRRITQEDIDNRARLEPEKYGKIF